MNKIMRTGVFVIISMVSMFLLGIGNSFANSELSEDIASLQKSLEGVNEKSERRDIIGKKFRYLLVKQAIACIGIPYVWGGTSKEGFDCSGFVQYVYKRCGLQMPRLARQQAIISKQIGKLKPGDVVTFTSSRSPTGYHSGIYVGKWLFVHAPGRGDRVKFERIDNPKYMKRLIGAYSPFPS